ncbi:hypothetical protein ALO43_200079 [Pseudomonas tremae]|uniref:Addiction module antitoxin RelB n=1 Tax=Pseudomonas tremae TaxID=200454 RepID=A0AA40TTT3_9PSED|nr:hypothetical protein ALO43_200079 [Pseudomonas tremae]
MWVGAAPRIDQHLTLQQFGAQQRNLQTHQPAQRMTHEMATLDIERVEQGQQFHGHMADRIVCRQIRRAASSPGMIVDQYVMVAGQRRQVIRPVTAGSAQPGTEHQQGRIGMLTSMNFMKHARSPGGRQVGF